MIYDIFMEPRTVNRSKHTWLGENINKKSKHTVNDLFENSNHNNVTKEHLRQMCNHVIHQTTNIHSVEMLFKKRISFVLKRR